MGFAAGLELVEGIVLRGRDDVVRLDPGDLRADDGSGEQRVLTAIFEIAAVARVAQEIDSAREHYVEAGRARLGANHMSALEGEIGVPSGRGRDAGGKRGALALGGRGPLGRHSDAGVGLPLRRDAQPGNAGNVSGRTVAA